MIDFDHADHDIEIPELDAHTEKLTAELEPAETESSTDKMLNKKSGRLLASSDPWAEKVTTDEVKTEDDETTPGNDEQESQEDKPESAAPSAPKVRTVSFKADGKNIEVPETAVISVKVDGKFVDVPVAELSTHYSGKVAWDKRFSELTSEKRAFAKERLQHTTTQQRSQSLMQDLHKNISGGDTFAAISSLVQLSGLEGKVDPRAYVADLRNALIEQAQKLAQLTPEERAHHEAKEEFEYTRKQLEDLRQQREREQTEYTSQVAFAKKLQEVQMPIEELQEAQDYLLSEGHKHGMDVAKLGPEGLLQHALSVRDYRTAIEALKGVSPEIAENRQYQDEAVKMLRAYPGTTREQLTDVFKEALGQKRSRAVTKKVSTSPVATTATAKVRTGGAAPKSNGRMDMSKITREDLW